jgi:hypothetical protein
VQALLSPSPSTPKEQDFETLVSKHGCYMEDMMSTAHSCCVDSSENMEISPRSSYNETTIKESIAVHDMADLEINGFDNVILNPSNLRVISGLGTST